jgi:hypothetical protein
VVCEAEKLGIPDERTALEPQVARDHRFHLIEQQLLGNATEPLPRSVITRLTSSIRASRRGSHAGRAATCGARLITSDQARDDPIA